MHRTLSSHQLQDSSSPARHQVKVPESQSSQKWDRWKTSADSAHSPVEQKGLRRLEAWGLGWGGLGTAGVWGGWSGYAGSGHRRPVQAAQISPARVGTSHIQLILSYLLCSPSVLFKFPNIISLATHNKKRGKIIRAKTFFHALEIMLTIQ